MKKIAGCVILFNPVTDLVVENIKSYIEDIDCLYIINNGNGNDVINTLRLQYDNIIDINYKENMGIAIPLNEVLRLTHKKYKFLLTMDQDSRFYKNSMTKYRNLVNNRIDITNTLCIGPDIQNFSFDNLMKFNDSVVLKEVLRIITSGSIINIDLAIDVMGFDEKLFIDEVDFDLCYKGYLKHYKCFVCVNGIILMHQLGNEITGRGLLRNRTSMNHNYIRKYYIIRNRMYIWRKYHFINNKIFYKNYIKANINTILDIVLLENNKFIKLKYCVKGFIDFAKNKMGKLCE